MSTATRALPLALFLSASLLLAPLGCNSAAAGQGSGTGSQLTGPATFNEQFQARNPRVCAKVTSPPNVSQATAMVQCDHESNSATGGTTPIFQLVTDITVEMGAARAYTANDSYWLDIDSSAKIYPLRGQSTNWACSPVDAINAGKNCQKSPGVPLGQGRCWHTLFNEWKCSMTTGGPNVVLNVKGPTTY